MGGEYRGDEFERPLTRARALWSAVAVAVIVGIVVVIVGGSWYVDVANQAHPAAWPMVQGDALGRFATRATFPSDPKLLWSYPLEEATGLPPVIGEDGTLYLHTRTGVVAVGVDGQRKWAWKSEQGFGLLALGRHGQIYVAGETELTALDSLGRLLWRFPLERGSLAPPLVGQGGVIYVSTGPGLLAVTSEGKLKWEYNWRQPIGWPVETPRGDLLVTTPGRLRAVRPDGTEAWSVQFRGRMMNTPVSVDRDGTIYYRGADRLYVLDDQGQTLAEYPVGPAGIYNLALGEGVIQGGAMRWSESGEVLWNEEEISADAFSFLDGAGNALMLFLSRRGTTMGLSLRGPDGSERWSLSDLSVLSLPAIGRDGRICLVGQQGDQGPALICLGDQ